MAELAGEKPPVTRRTVVDPARKLTRTLFEHYTYRRAVYSVEHPKTYDDDLLRLFSDAPRSREREAAGTFLRRASRARSAASSRDGPASTSSRSTRSSTT